MQLRRSMVGVAVSFIRAIFTFYILPALLHYTAASNSEYEIVAAEDLYAGIYEHRNVGGGSGVALSSPGKLGGGRGHRHGNDTPARLDGRDRDNDDNDIGFNASYEMQPTGKEIVQWEKIFREDNVLELSREQQFAYLFSGNRELLINS
ncbi:hypothetical protein K0M31_006975 [Melipona bicolor]|uniref:Uncharacterized protein n=1 Tax=Melipona bicolor TaxID=60889 RepID=A0AA40FRD3_9HYME|nr:hypothetical protein K0M31_006975 [Melipona bicolor]